MEPTVQCAFTRELIVHMTSYGVRPSTNFCLAVARKIILKYPFLRDAVGSGYVSISAFVLFNNYYCSSLSNFRHPGKNV